MPILLHGTTRHRAVQIMAQGPDPDFMKPGSVLRADRAESFWTCLEAGPFLLGTPEEYARGIAKTKSPWLSEGKPFIPRGSRRLPVSSHIRDRCGGWTAKDYHAVQLRGSAELKEAVDRQEVSISDAAQVARIRSPEEQTVAVERVRAGAASTLRHAVAQQSISAPAVDPLGVPIPDHLADAFAARSQFKEALSCLSRAGRLVSQIQVGRGAGLLPESEWQAIARQVGQLRTQLEQAEPYAVCPDCLGVGCRPDNNQGLPICRGTGFISRLRCPKQCESMGSTVASR